MKSKEQSAIEQIYEIASEIKQIKQILSVMDANIKTIYNQINKPKATNNQNSSKQGQEQNDGHKIKLFGRIKNQHNNPMENVFIKIFNAKGDLVKARNTNADGYWEARVSPGVYSVELNASHINPKIRPHNFNIEVDEKMNEYEVLGKRS